MKTEANSVRSRTWPLFVLTAIFTINFVDRQILVILQEPIKRELALSDAQLGLLTGFAFVAVYVTFGLPVARIADRSNRRNIVSIAVLLWSAMTAVTGLAQSYLHLLLARAGVGIGEAGGTPPSHSMIADLFPRRRRLWAMSVFQSGTSIGILIGFLVGGWAGQQFGWRVALAIAGIPGILLGLLLLTTVAEPSRQVEAGSPATQGSFFSALSSLFLIVVFRRTLIALVAVTFATAGITSFAPSFFIRSYGLSLAEVGIMLAIMNGAGGLGVTLLVGIVSSRMVKRDASWPIWFVGAVLMLAFPAAELAFLWHRLEISIAAYAVLAAISGATYGVVIGSLQDHVPATKRALLTAVIYLCINLIGFGVGPLFVGALSDHLASSHGVDALRFSLAICGGAYLAAGALYWMAAPAFRTSGLENGQSLEEAPTVSIAGST